MLPPVEPQKWSVANGQYFIDWWIKKKKIQYLYDIKYKVHELANPLFKPPVVTTPSGWHFISLSNLHLFCYVAKTHTLWLRYCKTHVNQVFNKSDGYRRVDFPRSVSTSNGGSTCAIHSPQATKFFLRNEWETPYRWTAYILPSTKPQGQYQSFVLEPDTHHQP